MTKPQIISGLSDLADRYDVILSDVWGVIHNGRESFPAACGALAKWRADKGPVVLISNSPRPSAAVHAQLDELRVPREAWSAFVSSGDATRVLLGGRAPGPAWAIGPDRDAPLYDGLELTFAGPEDAAFVSVTGPYDDEVETPEHYRARFEQVAARGLTMICANPDLVVQRGDRLIYCGGALAQLYAQLGGEVIMAGKPYSAIYGLCLGEAEALLGRPVDRRRVLCIGDGLPTDVKGANDQDLDILFVASGIHGAETIGPDGLRADAVADLLGQAGLTATYAIADLVW
ncbi:TIGR01459 family HAD-type hydrolase [Phenylobacterium aquaticum]|uniref:TIGR01459 family HAD-type hydrolase n=1 Tax=Phenylobacterium aquaticum TaxID=1763816 RepID=UPI001F5D26B6|nr:TIGR01459 family HAD-type hydrolase [Phenylobacterium aquaticum]MCI3134202.1 TIGR01459 family HAD-type hydrolase [Phenylobacterium aquaticum]